MSEKRDGVMESGRDGVTIALTVSLHNSRIPSRTHCITRGLTYIEVVISLLILATAVVAGLQAFASYALGQRLRTEACTGLELANQLMAEINTVPFADPAGSTGIGLEAGEVATDRSTFDDVDDYDGWDESPPADRTGSVLAGYTGYRRRVTVEWDTSVSAATGVILPAGLFKRITVTVLKNDRPVATLVTVRGSYAQ